MRKTILLLTTVYLLLIASYTFAQSGHTNWNGWSFDWEVTNGEGLALRNASFNNEFVLWKASMPVIRVARVCVGAEAGAMDYGAACTRRPSDSLSTLPRMRPSAART